MVEAFVIGRNDYVSAFVQTARLEVFLRHPNYEGKGEFCKDCNNAYLWPSKKKAKHYMWRNKMGKSKAWKVMKVMVDVEEYHKRLYTQV